MVKYQITILLCVILLLSSCSHSNTEDLNEYTTPPTPTMAPTSTPSPSPTATQTPAPTPQVFCGDVQLENPDSSLNLRESPDTSAEIIEKLAQGTEVIILATEDAWYKVEINDKVGYVSINYIDNVREYTASDEEPTESVSDGHSTVWINVDTLRIREQPGTDSAIIGKIPYGESVKGIRDDDWMYTTYNEVKGYIFIGKVSSGRTCVVYSSSDLVPLPTET